MQLSWRDTSSSSLAVQLKLGNTKKSSRIIQPFNTKKGKMFFLYTSKKRMVPFKKKYMEDVCWAIWGIIIIWTVTYADEEQTVFEQTAISRHESNSMTENIKLKISLFARLYNL